VKTILAGSLIRRRLPTKSHLKFQQQGELRLHKTGRAIRGHRVNMHNRQVASMTGL